MLAVELATQPPVRPARSYKWTIQGDNTSKQYKVTLRAKDGRWVRNSCCLSACWVHCYGFGPAGIWQNRRGELSSDLVQDAELGVKLTDQAVIATVTASAEAAGRDRLAR